MSTFQVPDGNSTTDKLIKPVYIANGNPFIPAGLRIYEHVSVGQILATAIELAGSMPVRQALHENTGFALKGRSNGKRHIDAGVLDFFLEYPTEIPKAWEGKFVYFLGTTFRDAEATDRVCCINKRGNKWVRGEHPLTRPVSHRSVCAVC